MDVGITQSPKDHSLHFATGLFVLTLGYSAALFVLRLALFS